MWIYIDILLDGYKDQCLLTFIIIVLIDSWIKQSFWSIISSLSAIAAWSMGKNTSYHNVFFFFTFLQHLIITSFNDYKQLYLLTYRHCNDQPSLFHIFFLFEVLRKRPGDTCTYFLKSTAVLESRIFFFNLGLVLGINLIAVTRISWGNIRENNHFDRNSLHSAEIGPHGWKRFKSLKPSFRSVESDLATVLGRKHFWYHGFHAKSIDIGRNQVKCS